MVLSCGDDVRYQLSACIGLRTQMHIWSRLCIDPAWSPSLELSDIVTDRHPNLAAFQLTATLPVSLEVTFLGGLPSPGERHTSRRLQLLFAGLSGLVSGSDDVLRQLNRCYHKPKASIPR